MNKFKYLKLKNKKKLRYLSIIPKRKIYLVFLHGFMSDLEGEKPKNFQRYCKKKKIGFLALEYSGHGKSSGKFTRGNITKWSNETKIIIKKIIKKNKFILVGSSMGAWIALNQFKYFSKQIKGFIGIGSAPEFLQRLMWDKFTKKIKREILTKKIHYLKIEKYEYPITLQLIKDGKLNKVLHKKFKNQIPITMLHGNKDEVVPLSFSKKILSLFKNAKKKLIIIKNGDHSLSSKKNLNKINKEIDKIIYSLI